MAEANNEAALQRWYRSVIPLHVDIIGDFAGKELFAIHGDSLLRHCTAQAGVDFTDGFQLLHAIHAVETVLAKLRQRGCQFHILWFRQHEQLCIPDDAAGEAASNCHRLVRAILIRHLHQHTQNSVDPARNVFNFEFQDVHCPEFGKHLAENAIHFFLCFDGFEAHGRLSHTGIRFLDFVHHISSRGYSVALINTLEIASSKVLASVFSPTHSDPVLQINISQPGPLPRVSDLQCGFDHLPAQWTPWHDEKPIKTKDLISFLGIANTLLRNHNDGVKDCAAAYIVHLSAMRRCHLSQRSCAVVNLDTCEQESLNHFVACFADICVGLVESLPVMDRWDAFDLLDGRILRQIFKKLPSMALTPSMAGEVNRFAKAIHELTDVNLAEFIPTCPGQVATSPRQQLTQSEDGPVSSVLPFNHPVLDKYLETVRLVTDDATEPTTNSTVFQELSHWHNAKLPLDPKHVPRPQGFFARKRNQRLMAETVAYSASLTNASGKTINPEIIVRASAGETAPAKLDVQTHTRDTEPDRPATHQPRSKNQKHPRKGGRESARQEAQRIQKAKLEDKAGAVMTFWDERCQEFQAERNPALRLAKATRYLDSLSDKDAAIIGAEVSLYICDVLASMIIFPTKSKSAGAADEFRTYTATESGLLAMLWSRILKTTKMPLSADSLSRLDKFSKALQIQLPASTPSLTTRRLPFPSIAPIDELKLPEDGLDFQLKHCGPYLEKSFDPMPDARVPYFLPDAWQRKVLDAIDGEKSVFVVAPTSAGKTFISFYAMKKVLRSSDDDVLVYVAPTRALVNQIAAEIQARFSKTYTHDGRSVWAIHTRDYRINNPTGCQVLVTMPHILQIMLLAPSNASKATSWSRRVKTIIFDEVHCIGQADDGVVWEQLLLMAPCPVIALSATVGNPLDFKDWLEASEKAKGIPLEMIVHPYRYSDLRKFLYKLPEKKFTFRGLAVREGPRIPGLDEVEGGTSLFSCIHPVVSLVNRNRGTLDGIHLESRDCLALWKCMSKHQTEGYPVDGSLNPHKFFRGIAHKPDVVRWEAELKRVLGAWMRDAESPFAAVRSELGASLLTAKPTPTLAPPPGDGATFGVEFQVCQKSLRSQALPLLTDLHKCGALPAILFNFDRDYCEKTLFAVVDELTEAETAWKDSSPEWKKKLAEYERWSKSSSQANRSKKEKAPKSRPAAEPGLSKMDLIQEAASKEGGKWDSFDPEAPLNMFSFADGTKLLGSELADLIYRLKDVNLDLRIVNGLRRGIAVHHAGMNRRYRQIVEMLFRKGFLTAVVATGTLALGLNMPCKTVVFFGDSVFLTALNYLQAAGRAGRRGFDLLGNVVFAGMRVERVLEIMSSRLPDLSGHFPLSTTLVLRLLSLLHQTDNSTYAARAVGALLSQTRIYLGGPSDRMTIQHHLRFSIEYLRRQHLVSREGTPLNLSGLVGHLYFTENSVFALHSLLKGGYFHDMCEAMDDDAPGVLLDLVLVLAHLFCRIPVRNGVAAAMAETLSRSPSLILLPRLPDRAEELLVEHNREALDTFRTYVGYFVEQHLSNTPDTHLPLTGLGVGAEHEEPEWPAPVEHLPATKLCSPFAALSGFTDEFDSIHSLCSTVRSGVFLEESAVPHLRLSPRDTAGVPWNAYIYDFFKHGDLTALVRDSGIKRGDVWYHLKDFSLVLAAIVTSLTNFLAGAESGLDDDDCAMLNLQDVGDRIVEDGDAALGGPGPPAENTGEEAAAAAPAPASPKKAGKQTAKAKAVVSSWEDALSDGTDSADEDGDADAGKTSGVPLTTTKPSGQGAADGGWGSGTSSTAPRADPEWKAEGGRSLVQVLAAFRRLQEEFDEKFRKVWA